MAGAPVPGYQEFWADKRASLEAEYKTLVGKYPDADTQYRQLYRTLCAIEDVAGYAPAVVGESAEWTAVVSAAEENRASYCKALSGKTLLSAMYGTYSVTITDFKSILKVGKSTEKSTEKTAQDEDFQEVRRCKRHNTTEAAPTSKKAVPTGASAPVSRPPKEKTTRNFFAPLRTAKMDIDSGGSDASSSNTMAPGKTGRTHPIILTSAVNLIQLQKQVKGVVSEDFEFRSTRNGTRVITRGMADFQSVISYFDSRNLSYFSFYPKSQKPIKAVIRHLPQNAPAENISDGLMSLGFDVINVKQMTTSRRSPPEQSKIITLPLFLVTLTRTPKSQEIFRLPSLCHIAIRVEAYRSQNSLTQCHNCQQFGHVWANCKQTTSLFVVRGRTPAQGVSREEHIICTSMLQLPVGGQ
jgi:hypothetical protein